MKNLLLSAPNLEENDCRQRVLPFPGKGHPPSVLRGNKRLGAFQREAGKSLLAKSDVARYVWTEVSTTGVWQTLETPRERQTFS